MTPSEIRREGALMMIVGFQKSWCVWQVVARLGVERVSHAQDVALHEIAPFFPDTNGVYDMPVRAYIAAQWPKLFAFLDLHASEPDRLIATGPQIERLTYRAERKSLGYLSKADKKEGSAARVALLQAETANRCARRQQLSTQRSAWNVCKG